MKHLWALVSLTLVFGCNKPAEQTSTATAAPPPSTTEASATSAPAPTPAPAPAPTSTAPSAGALASQQTNWKGITASITEFRRKGNTLTAKVHLVNGGSEEVQPEIKYEDVYLIDTGAGKKFNVLKDEKGAYIAANRSGWNDRWYDHMKPGDSYLLWMKFPAPPAETKAITLQLPNMAPFEDVAIQE